MTRFPDSKRAHHSRKSARRDWTDRIGFNANPLLTVALPAWRSKLMLFLLFVGFVALVGRAFYLMGGVSTGFLQRQGEARYARTLEIPATRGRITDRNGVVLASSVPARAVWAIPEDVDAGLEQLNTLARLLQMNVSELKRRLADDDRTFVYLRRQVDADPPDAQHEREKLLRNAKLVGGNAVAGHQQPAGHALRHPMEAVARRGLRDLDHQQVGKEEQLSLQRSALAEFAAKVHYLHPHCCAAALYHGTKRRDSDTQCHGKPDHAFRADESDLGRPVGIHGSQHRDEAVAGKVHVPNAVLGFIENLPKGQLYWFEDSQQFPVVLAGQSGQYAILN